MAFALNRLGQIALQVADIDRAEAFYRDVLGLRHLYRFGEVTFFDCQGVRVMIEQINEDGHVNRASPLYFTVADITLAVRELMAREVTFLDPPHLIARMDDHDLWMAFFADPDGHILALMQEAPKDYVPPPI